MLATLIVVASAPLLYLTGTHTLSAVLPPSSISSSSVVPRRLFGLSFSTSSLLFLLLLVDIGGLSVPPFLWFLLLSINLIVGLVVVPFVLCFHLTRTLTPAIALYLFDVFVFTTLTSPAEDKKSYLGFLVGLFTIQDNMTRVSVVGVALMAVLSGFGAVYTPYSSMSRFIKNVGDDHVREKEAELDRTQNIILHKQRRVLELTEKRGNSARDAEPGFFRRVIGSVVGSEGAELRELKREIHALEALTRTLNTDLEQLQYERDRYKASKTMYGQFLNLIGYFFSLYCIYKIITSCINLIFHNHGGTDPITLGINFAIQALSAEGSPATITIDVESSAQQLSFLMVGGLVFCSIRGLILQFSKLFRLISGTNTSITDTLILLFSETITLYSLSLVLMMRVSLPPQYRAIISNVLGKNIKFDFYQRWFDFIFLVAAVGSAVVVFAMSDGNVGGGGGAGFDMKEFELPSQRDGGFDGPPRLSRGRSSGVGTEGLLGKRI